MGIYVCQNSTNHTNWNPHILLYVNYTSIFFFLKNIRGEEKNPHWGKRQRKKGSGPFCFCGNWSSIFGLCVQMSFYYPGIIESYYQPRWQQKERGDRPSRNHFPHDFFKAHFSVIILRENKQLGLLTKRFNRLLGKKRGEIEANNAHFSASHIKPSLVSEASGSSLPLASLET